MMKYGVNLVDVLCYASMERAKDHYDLSITPLFEVSSANEKTRDKFLLKKFCAVYYKDDKTFEHKYFGSGADFSCIMS